MCGIFGVFNSSPQVYLSDGDLDIDRSMMIVTSLRGDHSTGLCVVPQRNLNPFKGDVLKQSRIQKTVGGPHNILHNQEGINFLRWATQEGNSIFGHGRYATRGKISVQNAHPFEEGDWILVHNGTIYSGLNHGGVDEPEVDSHALCMRINEVGLKEALTSINGAYAIIAYNKREHKVYAARNADRPLYYFKIHTMAFLMSEADHLTLCLERHNKYRKVKGGMERAEILTPDMLYELTPEGFKIYDEAKKPVPVYTPPVVALPSNRPSRPFTHHDSEYAVITGVPPDKRIRFMVDTIERTGTGFLFECLGEEKEGREYVEVFFRTEIDVGDFIGRTGTAPGELRYWLKKEERARYKVRFADIVWDELVPSGGSADPVGQLVPCHTCQEPVEIPDGGVQLHSGHWTCMDCVNDFERNRGHGKVATRIN